MFGFGKKKKEKEEISPEIVEDSIAIEEPVKEETVVVEPAEAENAVEEVVVESAEAEIPVEEVEVEPAEAETLEEVIEEPTEEPTEEPAEEPTEETTEEPGEAESPEEVIEEPTEEEKPAEKQGFFARLKAGLSKTRDSLVGNLSAVFKASNIDDDFYEEIEEILIMGDLGVHATQEIIEDLKKKVKEQHIKEPADCKQLLMDSIMAQMELGETAYEFEEKPSVVFVIGVNGVGKTTTIGKLASKLNHDGKKVVLAAADTFRAAAGDQLKEWARRADVEMIGGQEGADPSSVVYDAAQAAKARHADVLMIDTAGRLHNKKNLMDELAKMNKILDREFPDWHRETLVVLDAATGQNALQQAKIFGEAAKITGIVLTKMDGTAKGGIAVAIQSELGIPVKYIGVGEKIEDLQKFNAEDFVNALFATED